MSIIFQLKKIKIKQEKGFKKEMSSTMSNTIYELRSDDHWVYKAEVSLTLMREFQ